MRQGCSPSSYPVHKVWMAFLANAAAVVLAVAFPRCAPPPAGLDLADDRPVAAARGLVAGLVHAATGIPVHFLKSDAGMPTGRPSLEVNALSETNRRWLGRDSTT